METATLISQETKGMQSPAEWHAVYTHSHTYSGRDDHGGTLQPPENYRRLAEFCAARQVAALGMGSPYEPVTAREHAFYEGAGLADYLGGKVNQEELCRRELVAEVLRQTNEYSGGRTLFYHDNETPKGRFGHMWWVNYHYDRPPWHDYDQYFDQWMVNDAQAGEDRDEPMAYERRAYREIQAIQRAHGALGFWAHPTSWWLGGNGQFITNIASEMPAHLAADGFVDGMVVMGYRAYRPQYLSLWFALLDRGYRVPGVAEMDGGLSDEKFSRLDTQLLLTRVHREQKFSYGVDVAVAMRSGRMCVSSGPHIEISVDGVPMGSIARTSGECVHTVEIHAQPAPGQTHLDRIELLGHGGCSLFRIEKFPGGTLRLKVRGLTERGYLLAQCFGEGDASRLADFKSVLGFAVSNPVYLHPPGQSFQRPVMTELQVRLQPDSNLNGATLRLENERGELLELLPAENGVRAQVPSGGRITAVFPDGRQLTRYLINLHPEIQRLQRYLYRGRFLRDFPGANKGEVPVAAWNLDDFPKALQQLELAEI